MEVKKEVKEDDRNVLSILTPILTSTLTPTLTFTLTSKI